MNTGTSANASSNVNTTSGAGDRPDVKQWANTEKLWADRRSSYWMTIVPYIGYVIRSGFGILLAFGFIAGTAYYAAYLEKVPADFPIRELALILLAPAIAYTTYRTFIVEADRVFFLRIEHRMQPYMRRSIRYSLIPRLLLLTAVWFVLWPLYQRVEASPKPFLIMLLVWLILKLVAAYGAWVERHVTDKRICNMLRLARYVWCWGAVACWLWLPMPIAGMITGAVGIAYVFAARYAPALSFAWDAHMEAERVHQQRIQNFLSAFVEMPAMEDRRYARPLLGKFGNRYAFRKGYAYHYLFAKTLVRSEWLAIWLRLTLLGTALIAFANDTEWNGALLALFLVAVSAQNRTLFRFHQHDVWYQLYPLSPTARKDAALSFSTRFHLLSALVMLVPVLVGPTSPLYRAAAAGIALLYVALVWWTRSRSSNRDADDDD